MKKILPLILICILIGCTTTKEANNNDTNNDSNNSVSNNQPTLPDFFPTDLGLIPEYAEIVSIREKEGVTGVDVILASDGSINGLRDYYEKLFGEDNVTIEDKDDGYYLTATKGNYYYTTLISYETYEGHAHYDGKICITLSLLQKESETSQVSSDDWPTHGVSSHLSKLPEYTNLDVTTFSNDEISISCNTSEETLRSYAQSIIKDFPLNQTSIDEEGLYSISGQDNNGLVFSAQHESSTNEAIILIYLDAFFDPNNPSGKNEHGVPNWVDTP